MSSDTESKKTPGGKRDAYPARRRKQNMERRRYSPASYNKPEWSVTAGRGVVIDDIKPVHKHLAAVSKNSDFIKELHLVMYSRTPKTKEVKKNVQQFSGLAQEFDKEEKQKYIEDKLDSKPKDLLIKMYRFFNLKALTNPSAAKKEKLCKAIFEFLDKPSKDLCAKKTEEFEAEKKTKKVTTHKRKRRSRSKSDRENSSSSDDSSSESEAEDKKKARKSKSSSSSKSDTEAESKKRKRESSDTESKSNKKSKTSKSDTEKSEKSGDESESDKKSRKRKSTSKDRKSSTKRSKEVSVVDELKDKLEPNQAACYYAKNNRTKCADLNCRNQIHIKDVSIARATGKKGSLTIKFYHPECFFDAQERFKPREGEENAKIESTKDFVDFTELKDKDKKMVEKYMKKALKKDAEKKEKQKKRKSRKGKSDDESSSSEDQEEEKGKEKKKKGDKDEKAKEGKDTEKKEEKESKGEKMQEDEAKKKD